eukprot:Mrub_07624.p1 GENE.Mrub_07624~~Mrub_07624.p1  ORF type:complete len:290 (+),score=62.63 Mrub_07624:90-872(+)
MVNNPLFAIDSEPEIVNKGFLNMRKSNADNGNSSIELKPEQIKEAKLEIQQAELQIMKMHEEKARSWYENRPKSPSHTSNYLMNRMNQNSKEKYLKRAETYADKIKNSLNKNKDIKIENKLNNKNKEQMIGLELYDQVKRLSYTKPISNNSKKFTRGNEYNYLDTTDIQGDCTNQEDYQNKCIKLKIQYKGDEKELIENLFNKSNNVTNNSTFISQKNDVSRIERKPKRVKSKLNFEQRGNNNSSSLFKSKVTQINFNKK